MKTSRLYFCHLIFGLLPESRAFALKRALLRWAGAMVGRNVRVCSSASILGDGMLVLGQDVWIGPGVCIASTGSATITIGDYSGLALGAMIFTGSHQIDPSGVRIHGEGTFQDVTIGKGCMVGARAVIMPGVKVADKTLVAAGAVVAKSVADERCLVAGVPAQVKKRY